MDSWPSYVTFHFAYATYYQTQIVFLVKEQNKTEFLNLYNPIHEPFCRFCRAISGNYADAEDLIQESILNVLEKFDRIKDRTSFKSYLFSVASNLNKMKRRRQKFKAEFSEDEINQIVDLSMNQEYLADFRIIYETILMLPERIAETLILFHISDLSLDEIRNIQGGSLSGVKLRLKRGREKLLSLLSTKEQVKLALVFLTF